MDVGDRTKIAATTENQEDHLISAVVRVHGVMIVHHKTETEENLIVEEEGIEKIHIKTLQEEVTTEAEKEEEVEATIEEDLPGETEAIVILKILTLTASNFLEVVADEMMRDIQEIFIHPDTVLRKNSSMTLLLGLD